MDSPNGSNGLTKPLRINVTSAWIYSYAIVKIFTQNISKSDDTFQISWHH